MSGSQTRIAHKNANDKRSDHVACTNRSRISRVFSLCRTKRAIPNDFLPSWRHKHTAKRRPITSCCHRLNDGFVPRRPEMAFPLWNGPNSQLLWAVTRGKMPRTFASAVYANLMCFCCIACFLIKQNIKQNVLSY